MRGFLGQLVRVERLALWRHSDVVVNLEDHLDFLGEGLRGEHVRDELEHFLRVKLRVLQLEITVAHRPQVDQILDKRVNEAELAHHDIIVVFGLLEAFPGGPARDENAHDLLQEVDHTEERRPHLMADHRREALRLLLLQVLFLLLHLQHFCLDALRHLTDVHHEGGLIAVRLSVDRNLEKAFVHIVQRVQLLRGVHDS